MPTTTSNTKLSAEEQSKVLYWPRIQGLPILPHDSRSKECHHPGWSTADLENVNFEENLANGLYDKGISVRTGKTLSGCRAAYSIVLDFDGIDAVKGYFGENYENVIQRAKQTRIEWHDDDKYRLHLFLLSNKSIKTRVIKIGNSQLEVRCISNEGNGSLIIVSPSFHYNGRRFTPLETETIEILDDIKFLAFESDIDFLTGIYTSDSERSEYTRLIENPEYYTKLGVGDGRHPALKRLAVTYYWRDNSNEWQNISDAERKRRLEEWNNKLKVPKSQAELDSIWKWVEEHHKKARDKKHTENKQQRQQQRREQQNKNKKQQLVEFGDRMVERYHFKTMVDNDEMRYYDNTKGIYRTNAEALIKSLVEVKFHGRLNNSDVNEVIGQIQRCTYIDRDAFDPSIDWLACANCMINLLTGQTTDFTPDFMCTAQISVIYDPDYSTGQIADFFRLVEDRRGKIIKFLYEIMGPEDVDIFLDFIAYCLWRSYKYNFWMLFNGAGFNGKSILLDLIEKFLGIANVSGETLDRLLHEKFAIANIYQKMVNVDADVSADVVFNNTGILKKLTGNDLHTGEFKFKKPFKFINYAKLIFSCNKIPETEDLTDAFFRRIIIINFTQQFFGEKEDPHIIDKLCTQEEFTILLHELLSRLPRIIKNGLRKVTSERLAETYDKYTRHSNPIKYFYEKALEARPGNKVRKLDLYDWYEKFCREFGLAPESDQSLSRRLTEEFHLKYKRTRLNGETFYYWADIGLKDWKEAEKMEEENNAVGLAEFDAQIREAIK